MTRSRIAIALLLASLSGAASGAEPQALVRSAAEHVAAGRYALARAHLDPVVIDPRISASQRSRAYYLRGYTFLAEGFDVSAAQDYARALEFDPANADALEAVAFLHVEGRGVRRDERRAFDLFLRSARAGHVDSKAYVGYALLAGRGTEPNVAKARYWLNEAADAGHAGAATHLARSYRRMHTNQPEPGRARALYERAIAAGSSEAMVGLGYMHLEGELGTAEPERAAALFERATEAGSAEAAAALAHLYLTGRGVGQSDRRARELFESAAAHTYGPALSGLAYLHESGRGGLARNDARAQALYREAADAGDPAAQMHVATRLLATPTEANTREALRWLRAAAESGDASANNALAWVLATTSHDTLRDGSAARAAAERAVAAERSASTLDTLAAALAATSDFDAAVRRQEEAIAALTEEEAGLRAEFERRLARYAAGEPWRET